MVNYKIFEYNGKEYLIPKDHEFLNEKEINEFIADCERSDLIMKNNREYMDKLFKKKKKNKFINYGYSHKVQYDNEYFIDY